MIRVGPGCIVHSQLRPSHPLWLCNQTNCTTKVMLRAWGHIFHTRWSILCFTGWQTQVSPGATLDRPLVQQRQWRREAGEPSLPPFPSGSLVPLSGQDSLPPGQHTPGFPDTRLHQSDFSGGQGQFSQKSSCVVMCDYCEESFSRPWNLKVHLRRKHGIGHELKCLTCGAKFRSELRLRMHAQACLAQATGLDYWSQLPGVWDHDWSKYGDMFIANM